MKILTKQEDAPTNRLVRNGQYPQQVDADILLTNFCHFQNQLNENDPLHRDHWDVSVYITKHNLCTSDGSCDTLGLAEKYSICNPAKSCTIIEDTGLATAFTIAHEIGHLLGAIHDDDISCKNYGGEQGVMSPILSPMTKSMRTHLGPWRWSKCSAVKIKQSFNNGRGNCLFKRQSVMVRSLMPIIVEKKIPDPIKIISEDEQCQLIFGKGL